MEDSRVVDLSSGIQRAIKVRQHIPGESPHVGLERTGGSYVMFAMFAREKPGLS